MGAGNALDSGLCCWLEYDLRPAIVTCVEVLIGIWAFGELESMRNDLRWFGTTVMDKLGQATVIDFDVSLPSSNLLPLEPESAEIESHLAFLSQLIFGSWVLRYEHTYDADASGRFGRSD